METTESQLTTALEQARRRRIELRDALVAVEGAISAPAPGRLDSWRGTVDLALDHLADAFEAHVRGTEDPGGLYEEILNSAQNLSSKVRRLKDEHPVIRSSIATVIADLGLVDLSDDDALGNMRDAIQRVLGRIVRHRQQGADLVWEAYTIDIGGMG